jgi:hypothetical protein
MRIVPIPICSCVGVLSLIILLSVVILLQERFTFQLFNFCSENVMALTLEASKEYLKYGTYEFRG